MTPEPRAEEVLSPKTEDDRSLAVQSIARALPHGVIVFVFCAIMTRHPYGFDPKTLLHLQLSAINAIICASAFGAEVWARAFKLHTYTWTLLVLLLTPLLFLLGNSANAILAHHLDGAPFPDPLELSIFSAYVGSVLAGGLVLTSFIHRVFPGASPEHGQPSNFFRGNALGPSAVACLPSVALAPAYGTSPAVSLIAVTVLLFLLGFCYVLVDAALRTFGWLPPMTFEDLNDS